MLKQIDNQDTNCQIFIGEPYFDFSSGYGGGFGYGLGFGSGEGYDNVAGSGKGFDSSYRERDGLGTKDCTGRG